MAKQTRKTRGPIKSKWVAEDRLTQRECASATCVNMNEGLWMTGGHCVKRGARGSSPVARRPLRFFQVVAHQQPEDIKKTLQRILLCLLWCLPLVSFPPSPRHPCFRYIPTTWMNENVSPRARHFIEFPDLFSLPACCQICIVSPRCLLFCEVH